MELKDMQNQFKDIKFESVSPVSDTQNIELLSIQERIADIHLLKELQRLCISPAVYRQWLVQAKVRTADGKEKLIAAYPIGAWEGVGSITNYDVRTATGGTLIRFKKWKDRKHLNIVFSYTQFLTLLSQDLLTVTGGDFLILGYETDIKTMADRLKGRCKTITYWLQQPLVDEAMIFATDHTMPNAITDTLPMLGGHFDIGYAWRSAVRNGHKMPKYASCAKCKRFPTCKPNRGRWLETCRRYSPIDIYGRKVDGGRTHYLYV